MRREKSKSRSATHKGTCQCCGSLQKLPGGVLSTHGYTVKDGWFDGICPGTGYLPHELSCDLIERFRDSARTQIGYMQAEKDGLLNPDNTGDTVYAKYGHYVSAFRSNYGVTKSHTRYVRAAITQETVPWRSGEGTSERFFAVYQDPMDDTKAVKKEVERHDYSREQTKLTVQAYLNKIYIDRVIDPKIRATETYIQWQEERIDTWEPRELKEIK